MVAGVRLTRRAAEADIAELAFLSDRHGAALVDNTGTVAWLCLPRIGSGSLCAALLDARDGGHITVAPDDEGTRCERRYRAASLVLETVWHTLTGSARVTDCLVIDPDCPRQPAATMLRVCDGLVGEVTFSVDVAPRCDYGAAAVWVRSVGPNAFSMTAGNDGLLVWSDGGPARTGAHGVAGPVRVGAGDRWRLAVRYVEPAAFDDAPALEFDADAVDRMLDRTSSYWGQALEDLELDGDLEAAGVRESVVVLHGLTNAATGAVAAAATTSLPESDRGRTWDYRATWVRDAVFAARSLGELGHGTLADAFHRFILRTAAGDAGGVRVLYGMGGERRRPELERRPIPSRGAPGAMCHRR
jgi:GH15 family glucan-1,4-alpha-glucosidase